MQMGDFYMWNRGATEHRTDTIEWNKRMHRSLKEYKTSKDKKDTSIEILRLMEEKLDFNYETDYIILDEEAYFVDELEDYLNENKKDEYLGPQDKWNKELLDALTQGNILQIIKLMQVGKRLAYVKSINTVSQNAEYLGTINAVYNRIQRKVELER